ncbi:MAG TPA: ATP-dependent Clp protease adaptor ClpS [Fimbriimonadaceae bacterium]|nr:ATP-dependent Clp protease adaptor ClpS [Fimbriimonadaceae bacterium]
MPGRTTTDPVISPGIIGDIEAAGSYCVVIYNNDYTPFDEVIAALMYATECDIQEASLEAWEAHTFGSAKVHFAPRYDCKQVARIISSIGVRAEVVQEDVQ